MNVKIGILTFHNAFNSGAMLQAYALQTVLLSWGIDAFFVEGGGHQCSRRFPPVETLRQKLVYPLQFLNMLGIAQLRYARFVGFRDRALRCRRVDLTSEKALRDVDLLLVGSDQVWSPSCKAGLLGHYLLKDVPDMVRKASYAASFGGESIPSELREMYCYNLRRFAALTVREDAGAKIVHDFLGDIPCPVVLDPTLLLKQADYCRVEAPRLVSEKYVCMYCPADDKPLYDLASRFARWKGLRLVSIQNGRTGYWGSRINDWRATSPDRFLSLIKHATCVITDSFHGTVFSMLYGVPFAIRLMDGSRVNSRFETLLRTTGLRDHVVVDGIAMTDLERAMPFDCQMVEQRIDKARQVSLAILEKIVKGESLS